MKLRDEERLERIEAALADLVLLARAHPVIVEGKRDVAALRRLGVTGEILPVNTGESLIQFSDGLAARVDHAVLLTDWDRTGGTIARRLRDNCRGRVRLERRIRKTFAIYSEVSAVEELPGYVASLRRRIEGVPRRSPRADGSDPLEERDALGDAPGREEE